MPSQPSLETEGSGRVQGVFRVPALEYFSLQFRFLLLEHAICQRAICLNMNDVHFGLIQLEWKAFCQKTNLMHLIA